MLTKSTEKDKLYLKSSYVSFGQKSILVSILANLNFYPLNLILIFKSLTK